MDISFVQQAVKNIIDAIQNTGIAVVKSLTSVLTGHTYSVEVKNPTKEVRVIGKVDSGQEATQTEIKKLSSNLELLRKELPSLKEVTVKNQISVPEFPKVPDFPDFPKFPEEIKIKDGRLSVSNINVVSDGLSEVRDAIKKIDIKPQVNVKLPTVPTPIVNVPQQPAPVVNVEKPDLSVFEMLIKLLKSFVGNPKNSVSVRLSDGKEFYKAIDRVSETVTASKSYSYMSTDGVGSFGRVNDNNEVLVTSSDTWDINNSDKLSADLEYIGEESVSGLWRVRKISKSGTVTTVQYASIKNNHGIVDYPNAWDNRTSLVFGRASEAL